jgi:hypothetical protein
MKRDIDRIIDRLQAEYPSIRVEKLKVRSPADDDGLWFFTHPACTFEVQIESFNGTCPFLIETDEHSERVVANSVESVLDTLKQWLHL